MDAYWLNRLLLLVVALPAFTSVASQTRATAKAEVDKKYIVLGERIELSLEASIPRGKKLSFFSIDTIPHFEILERQKTDTVKTGNLTRLTAALTITSFDSGRWTIPAFVLPGTGTATDTLQVSVGFAPFDRNKDYNDIKEVIDVEGKEHEQEIPWYWYAAGAILILALLYFLTRKKKKDKPPPRPPDPYKEALSQLDQLETEALPASGRVKEYYSRLDNIFRTYIFKRKGLQSLQKTTDDLMVQLKGERLSPELYNQLVQVLRLGDFVKFAKYEPSRQDNEHAINIIRQAVRTLEQPS